MKNSNNNNIILGLSFQFYVFGFSLSNEQNIWLYCLTIFFFNFRTRDAIFDPKDGSVQMHLRGKPIQFFAPSDTKNSYSLFESQHSKLAKLPDMKLEWVYGYRSIIFKLHLFLFNLPYFREQFPPLNSFRTLVRKPFKFSLHKRKLNTETI